MREKSRRHMMMKVQIAKKTATAVTVGPFESAIVVTANPMLVVNERLAVTHLKSLVLAEAVFMRSSRSSFLSSVSHSTIKTLGCSPKDGSASPNLNHRGRSKRDANNFDRHMVGMTYTGLYFIYHCDWSSL